MKDHRWCDWCRTAASGALALVLALGGVPAAALAEEVQGGFDTIEQTEESGALEGTDTVEDPVEEAGDSATDQDAQPATSPDEQASDDTMQVVAEPTDGGDAADSSEVAPADPAEEATDDAAEDPAEEGEVSAEGTVVPDIMYEVHVQKEGWQSRRKNGELAGTSGKSRRLECMRIWLQDADGKKLAGISYKAHVQNVGWTGWSSDGADAGTTGKSRRIEGLKIKLSDELAEKYDVLYRVHAQDYGWMDWTSNGAPAGSTGHSKRIEAVEIKLQPKGEAPIGARSYVDGAAVSLNGHVQNIGWQGFKDGSAGTTGRSLRMEAVRAKLNASLDASGGITYRAHVQNIGWQKEVSNGATAGTTGRSLRVEAISFKLTGEVASLYDVYYRTHVQNIGWTGWAKNGENSGSQGLSYRMEGVQVRLVPKGGAAPKSENGAMCFISGEVNVGYDSAKAAGAWQGARSGGATSGAEDGVAITQIRANLTGAEGASGSLVYQTKNQRGTWGAKASDGADTPANGSVSSIRFELTGVLAKAYNVYYRAHVAGKGWLIWSYDGEENGATDGMVIDAYQLRMVAKAKSAPGNGSSSLGLKVYGNSKRSNTIERYLAEAIAIANDDRHGYSQPNRWGPDYDCSSLVIHSLQVAGLNTSGATYTGDMLNLAQRGWTVMRFKSKSQLQRGDILLTPNDHTEFYLGEGRNVRAWMSEYRSIHGKAGDQTGHEIEVVDYHNNSGRGWVYVLRLK